MQHIIHSHLLSPRKKVFILEAHFTHTLPSSLQQTVSKQPRFLNMNGSGSSSGWNVYTSTNGNATRQYLQNSSSRASSRPDDMIILEHIEYREEVPITPPPEMGATHPPIGFPTVTIDTPSPRIIPSSWNAVCISRANFRAQKLTLHRIWSGPSLVSKTT